MVSQKEIILSIFYLKHKVWGRTYLQKLIYLINREIFKEQLFDFKFYKYGPYSEEINEELTDLEIEGNIDENAQRTKGFHTAYTYELTENGKKVASDIFNRKLDVALRDKLINYINKFGNYTPTELLKYVYEEYPEVTENSEFGME